MMENKFKGPQYYEEKDRNTFLGRKTETEDLFYLVSNNDFSVCYAESGEGKSSLIRAGLYPLLRQHGMFPVLVRFDKFDKNVNFDEFVWAKLEKEKENVKNPRDEKENPITYDIDYKTLDLSLNPIIKADENMSQKLWWRLQSHDLRLNTWEKLTPVFIFDQFEEVFTQPEDLRWTNSFFEWLEELYNGGSQGMETRLGAVQRNFKLLISLRSEYVCELDYWSMTQHFIPSLKNNRFFLKPLTKKSALEVANQLKENRPTSLEYDDIIRYAKTERSGKWEDVKEELPCVSALILSLILTGLSEKDTEVESKMEGIRASSSKDNGKELFDFLIDNVYKKALMKCDAVNDETVKNYIEILEDTLIVNGRRHHVSEKKLPPIVDDKIRDALVILEKERIINSIDHYYEISHDSLCNVIAKRKNERNRKANIALRRELHKKNYWNNLLLLIPIFILLYIAVYFLLNAIMNEMTLFDGELSVNGTEEIVCYENSGVLDILRLPIIHIIGNAVMILMVFMVSNFMYMYINNYRDWRYKFVCGISCLVSFGLCFWHWNYYVPNHKVFLHMSLENEILGWYFIYFILIAIPLFFILLLLINKSNNHKQSQFKDLIFLKLFFSQTPSKIYTIFLLFICLFVCVYPQYSRPVSSTESVFFVLLIGLLVHSIFEKSKLWTKRLILWLPILVFCTGLFVLEGEYTTALSTSLMLKDPRPAYLTLFLLFLVAELFICKVFVKHKNKKTRFIVAYITIVLTTTLASILYIGCYPWQKTLYPHCNTLRKWKFFLSKNNHLYGAYSVDGKELLPYSFDSVNSANYKACILNTTLDKLKSSKLDSHFFEDIESISTYSFDISQKDTVSLIASPYLTYIISNGKCERENKDEKYMHYYSSAAHHEILNTFISRLKDGGAMHLADNGKSRQLCKVSRERADNLYNSLKNRNNPQPLPTDSLMMYFEAVVREFTIVALNDMMKGNSLYFAAWTFSLFEEAYFHQYMNWAGNIKATKSYRLTNTQVINYNKDKYDLSFSVISIYDLKGLSKFQQATWLSLWKVLCGFTRQYVQTDWAWELERMMNDLYAKGESLLLQMDSIQTEITYNTKEIIQSADDKELVTGALRKAIEANNKALNNLGKFFKNAKLTVQFTNRHKDIAELCKKRMNEIESLTDRTIYRNFGKEVKRDMMVIGWLTDFNSAYDTTSQVNTYKTVREMYKEDTIYINSTYLNLFRLQNQLVDIHKYLNTLNNKVEEAKK